MKSYEELKHLSKSTATEQDIMDMILQPAFWPNFPFLPLVNKKYDCAYLAYVDKKYALINGILPMDMMAVEAGEMTAMDLMAKSEVLEPDEVIRRGWMVD